MILSRKSVKRLKRNYGEWVLVTGATSGIGKEIATKFGEAGFKLVITGRRRKELEALSTYLFDNYQTEAVAMIGDLSQTEVVESLLAETKHIKIGIVILNAGFGTAGRFIDSDIEREINMLNLNCKSVLMMLHHFINKMKDQPQKGAIVLLSSIVAFQGVPNAAHYSATKAYVQSLGEALSLELRAAGIDILTAAPGPVATGFAARANMKMDMTLNPEDVGVPIIEAIGRKNSLLPGFLTKFLMFNLWMTPRWAKTRIMGKVMAGFTKHQQH